MRGAFTWGTALAVSVAAHGLAGLGLMLSLAPDPPPEQTRPETRLDLATYRVARSEARPEEASGEAADEAPASGTALSDGTIPVSRAEPRRPEAETLREGQGAEPIAAIAAKGAAATAEAAPNTPVREAAASGKALRAGTPVGARPVAVAVPRAEVARPAPAETTVALASVSGSGTRQGPVAPRSETLAVLSPGTPGASLRPARFEPAATIVAAARIGTEDGAPVAPEAEPAVTLAAAGPPVAPAPPDGVRAEARAPDADPLGAAEPVAEHGVAALAWSGGAGSEVDPVSLAAIQSFMRPDDLRSGAADPVRDGLGGLLASVPCSRLQTAFDPETGALELRGHIPEEGLRAAVLAGVRAQLGAAIPVTDNVRILPRPQCGALSGIAAVGLPQSEAQETDPKIVGAEAHARVYEFVDGDRLSFELQGPDYPAYFYIDYFASDGMVLHLQPNEIVPLARIGIRERLGIGAADGQASGLSITVAPPFGQEIMVAFAATEPLYQGLRPISEPAGPYLEMLADAVRAARRRSPDFKGEWVYFFVETRAR